MSEWQPTIGDRVEFIEPLERAGPRQGTVTGRHRSKPVAYIHWDGLTRVRPQSIDLLRPVASEAEGGR